jgi:hypothetical protein
MRFMIYLWNYKFGKRLFLLGSRTGMTLNPLRSKIETNFYHTIICIAACFVAVNGDILLWETIVSYKCLEA